MDAGIEALRTIHQTLAIDEQWTLRSGRGFTWWGHRLPQLIEAGPAVPSGETEVFRLRSYIPLLRNVRAERAHVEKTLNGINRLASCSAYIYDPASREVFSLQRGMVHAGTLAWRPVLLGAFFMQQLRDAEGRLDELVGLLDGEPMVSPHPVAGLRHEPDEMFSVVARYFSLHADERPGFRNRFEFDAVVNMSDGMNAYSFGATEDGLALEVPFGHQTALILMKADAVHPLVGAGLGVYKMLPERYDEADAARFANWLNLRELRNPFLGEFIGAWCKAPSADQFLVGHARFIPAALYRPGLILDSAIVAIGHVSDANGLIHADAPRPDVIDVIERRLGRSIPKRRVADSRASLS